LTQPVWVIVVRNLLNALVDAASGVTSIT